MTDPEQNEVAVLDLAGGRLSYFGQGGTNPGQFTAPSALAVGQDGRVYVLNHIDGTLQIFTVP
jgi:DNA-binding beta-propeller fold protein YncE